MDVTKRQFEAYILRVCRQQSEKDTAIAMNISTREVRRLLERLKVSCPDFPFISEKRGTYLKIISYSELMDYDVEEQF